MGSGKLSKREREIATLIAMGLDTARIAAELHVAPATVRARVRNAMAKLGARTRAQLVALALCIDGAIDMPRLPAPAHGRRAADDPGARK